MSGSGTSEAPTLRALLHPVLRGPAIVADHHRTCRTSRSWARARRRRPWSFQTLRCHEKWESAELMERGNQMGSYSRASPRMFCNAQSQRGTGRSGRRRRVLHFTAPLDDRVGPRLAQAPLGIPSEYVSGNPYRFIRAPLGKRTGETQKQL